MDRKDAEGHLRWLLRHQSAYLSAARTAEETKSRKDIDTARRAKERADKALEVTLEIFTGGGT